MESAGRTCIQRSFKIYNPKKREREREREEVKVSLPTL
jgi:hypothetical protein